VGMNANNNKPVIGLLGGIGSGKSTVAAELRALGCAVVDADQIGHEVLKSPDVKEELRQLWGEAIFDSSGQIDRRALGKVAFQAPENLHALNAILHPRIRRAIIDQIGAHSRDPAIPAIVLDAALLLETDWHALCITFVFVSAPPEARARRVTAERGWDAVTWKQRENSQKPLDMKAAKADHVVDNSSSVSCLREQVRSIFHRITGLADRPPQRP
jgi:dephospho-CoA kinase